MIRKRMAPALVLIFTCQIANAGEATGKISSLELATDSWNTPLNPGKGFLFITIAKSDGSNAVTHTCNGQEWGKRIAIPASYPNYKDILATLTAAYFAGKQVSITYGESCTMYPGSAVDYYKMLLK